MAATRRRRVRIAPEEEGARDVWLEEGEAQQETGYARAPVTRGNRGKPSLSART